MTFKASEDSQFTLDANDVALVIRANGDREMYIPAQSDPDSLVPSEMVLFMVMQRTESTTVKLAIDLLMGELRRMKSDAEGPDAGEETHP